MKRTIILSTLLLLTACAEQGVPPYADRTKAPVRMTDEQLCFALAKDQADPRAAREVIARDLKCADLLEPDKNHALPNPDWRDNVEAMERQ